MLDTFHIPRDKTADVQEFYANSPSAGASWYTWKKPRNVTYVSFYVLGGGGAGGAGAAGGANAGAGGGGGGSSAQCNIIFPAWALPDILYISVGVGGIGGTGIGGAGVASYITVFPATTPVNYILCQANGGSGGGLAAGATPGAVGTAGAATAIGNGPLAGLGFASRLAAVTDISLAGQNGVIGNVAAGGALTLTTTGLTVTGGGAGAGRGGNNAVGNAGGGITSIGTPVGAVFPIQAGGLGAATNATAGSNGSNGFRVKPNFNYFYGGTGGGSGGANLTTGQGGGNGGRGSFGSGGGGGGGCATGATPGQGGYGGDGLVIATAW